MQEKIKQEFVKNFSDLINVLFNSKIRINNHHSNYKNYLIKYKTQAYNKNLIDIILKDFDTYISFIISIVEDISKLEIINDDEFSIIYNRYNNTFKEIINKEDFNSIKELKNQLGLELVKSSIIN